MPTRNARAPREQLSARHLASRYPRHTGSGVCQSRLSHPRAGVMKSWVGLAFHRPHGVAAARAVKANFSACQRDAQLGRQRLHRGVALIAGLVQNQKIIGVGSVLVVSSTAPSVLRALMAAGTPEISTFLYILPHTRPVPVKSGVDGGPRNGEWRVAREEWPVASGERRVASGEWREKSGQ